MGQDNRSFAKDLKAILPLTFILSLRMLGLFMIYPVFAIYAEHVKGTTPILTGIAIGIYGLTQALLQFPFSALSDRLGRKRVITFGLIIFCVGSCIAALATNIYLIIFGRALQGAGAIGSTLIAYVADITKVENRTSAMALMGMTIGFSFALAMTLGPIFNNWINVSGIFWLTGGLALLGIIILHSFVPTIKTKFTTKSENFYKQLPNLLLDPHLMRFNLGILILHTILTASFIAIPHLLMQFVDPQHQWRFYLPILVVAFLTVIPLIQLSEKKFNTKTTLSLAITFIFLSQSFLFIYPQSEFNIIIALLVFFLGFSLLEAMLPSLVSKIAPDVYRGSAVGIFSTCQFFGIFLGGYLGGLVHFYFNLNTVFLFCAILATLWLIVVCRMKEVPEYCRSFATDNPTVT